MDTNIQKYLAFAKTLESGSFSKAAELMNYSQSGISRMIADLENDLGMVLLERGKSGVQPTSDGMQLLPYVRRVLKEYEKLRQKTEDMRGLETGLIRIATFTSFATNVLPRYLQAFQKDYPKVEFEIRIGDYDEIERMVLEGSVDVGINRLPSAKELNERFLLQDKLVAVLPPEHPLTTCKVCSLEALGQERLILRENGVQEEVRQLFAKVNVRSHAAIVTNDDYAVMAMVSAGLGVSILPEYLLSETAYQIASRPLDVNAYRRIGVILREDNTASYALTRFLTYVK